MDKPNGYIPPFGFISLKELAHRIGLADHRNLGVRLQEKGVVPVKIAQASMIRCEDLENLFPDRKTSNCEFNQPDDSVIPLTGLIMLDDLQERIGIQHASVLKDELKKLDVRFISIFGKRMYRCSDLAAHFEADE